MRAMVLAAAAASFLALSALPEIGAAQGDKPVVVTNKVTAKAKVVDVDRANRMVTLQQANGKKTDVKVGDQVSNFDHIKKGDHVVVGYYESVGLDLRKAQGRGEPSSISTGPDVVQLAPKGGKAGAAAANTSVMTARVDAVDYQKRLVTLRGPKGNAMTVRAGDRVKNLQQIKKGDQIEATYTQALAVSIEKPKA